MDSTFSSMAGSDLSLLARRSRVRRRGALSKRDRFSIVAEAALFLVVARLLIVGLPFSVLAVWAVAGRFFDRAGVPGVTMEEETCRRVRWAVRIAARRWAVCLPQSLAGNWMLARRGIASTVYLGVRRDADLANVGAHAWLRSGDRILLGSRQARNFVQIVELPLLRPEVKPT